MFRYLRGVKNKKVLYRWLKLVIIIYCLVGSVLYYYQDRLLFHPEPITAYGVYPISQPFVEKEIRLDEQTSFYMAQFPAKDSLARGVVLYFHGNEKNIAHYAGFAPGFTRQGYEVWMPDYPGFGKSTGSLTEAVLYEEALQVYKLARTKYPPAQIIIYGKSIGTGVAAKLASVRDCKRLILETPYYSLVSVIRRMAWMYPLDLMLHFRLPTNEYLAKVTAPVTIFQGTKDNLIPYDNAEALKSVLKPGDAFITLAGGTHTNLNEFPRMRQALDSLLRN